MMRKMSPEDVSLVLRGMGERPDSVPDLKHINLPTLIVIGEEDVLSTAADGELMRQNIFRQPFEDDSESGPLCALGAARSRCAAVAAVSGFRSADVNSSELKTEDRIANDEQRRANSQSAKIPSS